MSDAPSAFRQVTRTARKEHKCCECRRQIVAGENYVYSSGIWSGDPSDFKQCTLCSQAFEEATGISDTDEYPLFTQLSEWMGNYFYSHGDYEDSVKSIARDLHMTVEQIKYVLNGRFAS